MRERQRRAQLLGLELHKGLSPRRVGCGLERHCRPSEVGVGSSVSEGVATFGAWCRPGEVPESMWNVDEGFLPLLRDCLVPNPLGRRVQSRMSPVKFFLGRETGRYGTRWSGQGAVLAE